MTRQTFYTTLVAGTYTVAVTGATADTMIMSCVAVNIDGTNAADVDVDFTDASDSNTPKQLLFSAEVLGGDSASVLPAPQLLKTGDTLRARASANGDLVLVGWTESFKAT